MEHEFKTYVRTGDQLRHFAAPVTKYNAKVESKKPFPHEEELKTKSARLAELNTLLDMDKKDNEIIDGERSEEAEEPDRADSRDAR